MFCAILRRIRPCQRAMGGTITMQQKPLNLPGANSGTSPVLVSIGSSHGDPASQKKLPFAILPLPSLLTAGLYLKCSDDEADGPEGAQEASASVVKKMSAQDQKAYKDKVAACFDIGPRVKSEITGV